MSNRQELDRNEFNSTRLHLPISFMARPPSSLGYNPIRSHSSPSLSSRLFIKLFRFKNNLNNRSRRWRSALHKRTLCRFYCTDDYKNKVPRFREDVVETWNLLLNANLFRGRENRDYAPFLCDGFAGILSKE